MAASNDVLSTTLAHIVEAETEALYQNTAFLSNARKMGGFKVEEGGSKITVPLDLIEHSVSTAHTTGYEPVTTVAQGTLVSASYDWALASSTISISEKELLENRGEKAIVKILDTRSRSVMRRMGRELNTRIIAGSTGTAFDAVGSLNGYLEPIKRYDGLGGPYQSATVGGVSKATYQTSPGWQNAFGDVAGDFSANGLAKMRSIQTDILLRGSRGPCDLIILSEAAMNNLRSALFSQEQYVSEKDLDGGRQVMTFGGSKVDLDLAMPTASISGYFLNFNGLYLAVQDGADFAVSPFVDLQGYLVKQAKVVWMGQLVAEHLGSQGVLHDAETY